MWVLLSTPIANNDIHKTTWGSIKNIINNINDSVAQYTFQMKQGDFGNKECDPIQRQAHYFAINDIFHIQTISSVHFPYSGLVTLMCIYSNDI